MELIEGVVRSYEWGSRTALAELLGRAPTGEPQAELWLGANPAAPARLASSGEALDKVIASDPVAALGTDAAERFGGLPFLMKILAVAAPLSLQAHPSADQAAAGYDREEALGIPRDAAHRVFRDRAHKPEMVCALSRFEALCGLRDPSRTLELLETVPTRALDPLRQRLTDVADRGWRDLMRWLLQRDCADHSETVAATVRACAASRDDDWAQERSVVRRLGAAHPDDPAVLAALLLNLLVLEPGDAVFVGAGCLHVYLHGTAVEVMADSDNTLRGGLTAKPVCVAAMIDALDDRSGPVSVQRPTSAGGLSHYEAPVAEFSLTRAEVDGSLTLAGGPAIVLCCDGSVGAGGIELTRSSAAWVSAAVPEVVLRGRGLVFRAGLGRNAGS